MVRRIIGLICIDLLLAILLVSCKFSGGPTDTSQTDTTIPSAAQPLNNSTDQNIIQTLKWESDNAVSYDVYLDKGNPPLQIVASKINQKFFALTSSLDYYSTYYWRVVANFSGGSQASSPVFKFTTIANLNPSQAGYALKLKRQETQLPNNVNLSFQVVDLFNVGVTTLSRDDFEIYEDGLPLQSESLAEIKKLNELPNKIRTVLMLDNSTSLTNVEIEKIRTAASSFVNKMTPNQEVAIYQFSENIEILSDFTSNQNNLNVAINNYRSGAGSTSLYYAVTVGASLWEDNYSVDGILQGTMIVFTDGNETAQPTTEALKEAINAVSNKSVFTIGLRGKDPLDEETLQRLGTSGYFPINDISQLDAQFTLIQQSINVRANSIYQLNYKSPRRGGDYALTVRVKGNPYTGTFSFIFAKYSSAGFFSKIGLR
ncbi:MAG: VWA domain-containing protein [Ignavibacteriales bacterium]|nr:VWA domain-containing protein [Ignavibacteriales bacterium]